MATVHLICGLPCAGKTTYALELQSATGGALFTLDRWLITGFGRYEIADVGDAEHVRRVLACRELIWYAASQFVARGTDVLLDDGYFRREHRMEAVARAAETGARASIHFVDTPFDVLSARLASRNASLPTYNFPITAEALTGCLDLFEVPMQDEGAELIVVRGER